MNDRARTDATDDALHAESELELLTYLGMRRLLRARRRTEVLALAREANARHGRALAAWRAGTALAPMRVEGFEHLAAARDARSGAVVAMPHCGPYFRASLALADRDVLLTVLAEHRTYDEESAEIERLGPAYAGSFERPARELVQIVDASRSTAAWETIVALRRGRTALAYYDNNFGMDARAASRTSGDFDLCGARVVGRMGAALLAGTARVPLIPALARFATDGDAEDVVRLHAPIVREPGEALDAFAQRATRALFALLEGEIERDPTAWDLWFGVFGRTPPPALEVVEREPEMLDVLALRVRVPEHALDELETPYGRLIANLDRGTTLVRNQTYDAVAEIVREGASVEKLVFDLSPVVGDDDTALAAIRSLVEAGFLVRA